MKESKHMKKKTVFDYLEMLKSQNLIEDYKIDDKVGNQLVEYISYNSMDVKESTLFVCKGVYFKNEYLESAMEKGAICYVAQKVINADYNYIIVNNMRVTLSEIGRLFYDEIWNENLNLVGITGTKGKTTTTFFVNSILKAYCKEKGYVMPGLITGVYTFDGVHTDKSNNLTTPETFELHKLLKTCVDNECKYLTMEVSSQALKFLRTSALKYKVGAFVNIGEDHISDSEHPDMDDYLNSKAIILDQCEIACICDDIEEKYFNRLKNLAAQKCQKTITFGSKVGADYYGRDVSADVDTLSFTLEAEGETHEINVSIGGKFNMSNALGAIAITRTLGIPFDIIKKGLENVKVPGRMEVFTLPHKDVKVVIDYAHNDISCKVLFDTIQEAFPDRKIIYMFGSVAGRSYNRRPVLGDFANRLASKVVLTEDVGSVEETTLEVCQDLMRYMSPDKDIAIVPYRENAVKYALDISEDGWVVVMTGWSQGDFLMRGDKFILVSDVELVKEYIENVKKTL